MSPGEITRAAFVEVRSHKLRSALTLLGIVLGTLSITVMTSLLDGVVATVWEGFRDLGFDGVMFVQGREARDAHEAAVFTRSEGLQPSDAALIAVRGEDVRATAPMAFHEDIVRHGDVERRVRILGVTPGYAVVRERKVARGRFISDRDEETFARVCVIGHRLDRRLFGGEEAIGKTLTLGGRQLRVIGVATKLGNQFVDSDEFIEEMEGLYVPLATLRKFYTGEQAPLAAIAIKTDAFERLGQVQSALDATLKLAHRGAEDFRVENIAQEMLREREEVAEVLRSWKIVLGALAAISLVVGGIGLLSVMLISIGERVYEIGLRKALGATDGEIFLQFLAESVALSLIGGILGAGAGVGLTKLVGTVFPGGLPIQVGGLVFAVAVSITLGVVYGLYPALRASRLPPVEALRTAA